MSEKDDLEKICNNYNVKWTTGNQDVATFGEAILSWHKRYGVKVGREQVDKIIWKHFGHIDTKTPQDWPLNPAIDDLLSLLNNEPKKCPTCNQEVKDVSDSTK